MHEFTVDTLQPCVTTTRNMHTQQARPMSARESVARGDARAAAATAPFVKGVFNYVRREATREGMGVEELKKSVDSFDLTLKRCV